jgi:hypothetical protein
MGATNKTEANKYSRSRGSRSMPRHIPSLDDIRKAPNGNAAVSALISAGVNPEKLERAMQFVVFIHLMPPAVRFQDVRGFTRKSLPLFPDELRRTARRIELIRKNPMYAATLNFCVPVSRWEQTCSDLRIYARWLELVIRGIRQNAEDNPREYDLKLFSKRRLLTEVAEATGNPHSRHVATFNRLFCISLHGTLCVSMVGSVRVARLPSIHEFTCGEFTGDAGQTSISEAVAPHRRG